MTSGNSEFRPASVAPVGEAGCWLEGDDEIFPAPESARDDHAAPVIPGADSACHATEIVPEGKEADPGVSDRERLTELIRLGNPRHRLTEGEVTALADAITAAGWRPPLPESETESFEYGWRRTYDKPDDVRVPVGGSERAARVAIYHLHNVVVMRREVGPWIEVPRG